MYQPISKKKIHKNILTTKKQKYNIIIVNDIHDNATPTPQDVDNLQDYTQQHRNTDLT